MLKINPAGTANVGFILFFPAFFVFHFASAALGLSTSVGLFGETAILMFVATLVFWGQLARVLTASPIISSLFIFLLSWCVVRTLFAIGLSAQTDIPEGSLSQIFSVLISWAALMFVGLFMDTGKRFMRVLLWSSWLVMLGIAVAFLDTEYFIMNPRAIFSQYEVPSVFRLPKGVVHATSFSFAC